MTTQMQPVLAATPKTSDTRSDSREITPKRVNIDFNRPLREHLDRAAIQRGWQAYRESVKKTR
jgi:hypothetical protein